MSFKSSFSFSLILFLILNCSIQGQNSTDTNNSTTTSVSTTTSTETSTLIVISCPGNHVDPPNCTKCALNYENKDNKCLAIKNAVKPSSGIGRRIFFIFLACLLTAFLILGLLVVYGRLNQQRGQRSSLDPETNPDPSNGNTNIRNRFSNILQSIGLNNLNKRGRFNFFSISNNNNRTSGQYRQAETSRAHLSENPDEALLFDDPYADGGIHNSAANPYKSLTLAVT